MTGFLLGACHGVAVSALIRGLVDGVAPQDRAAVLAAIYLSCYLGAMLPNLVTGQLSRCLELPQVMLCDVAIALVATIATWLCARNPRSMER